MFGCVWSVCDLQWTVRLLLELYFHCWLKPKKLHMFCVHDETWGKVPTLVAKTLRKRACVEVDSKVVSWRSFMQWNKDPYLVLVCEVLGTHHLRIWPSCLRINTEPPQGNQLLTMQTQKQPGLQQHTFWWVDYSRAATILIPQGRW